MPDAARKDDPHSCPKQEPGPTPHVGGPILSGSPDVVIEFKPAARAGQDTAQCKAGGPDLIAQGCATVLINHKHAARVTDLTTHGGVIMQGASKVVIGVNGDAVTVAKIDVQLGGSKGSKPKPNASNSKCDEPSGDSTRDEHSENESVEKDQADASGNHRPTAVINIVRKVSGNYFEGEPVRIESRSFDQDVGSQPGDGIHEYRWNVRSPNGSFESERSYIDLTLGVQGDYEIYLTVKDAHSSTDTAHEVIRVGNQCNQHVEELDWLEDYVDSLVENARSEIGSVLGMSWASEMLDHWRRGVGGEMRIDPERVRGLFTVNREQSNVFAMFVKHVVPEVNGLDDGESRRIQAMIQRSFYAYSPPQFFASGGSTLESHLEIGATRFGSRVAIWGSIAHEWSDTYDWDGGKSTLIPWPSTGRFPYLIQQVPDEWFNRLRRCRGIGKEFKMRSTWYHGVSQFVNWPLSIWWSMSNLRWKYSASVPAISPPYA